MATTNGGHKLSLPLSRKGQTRGKLNRPTEGIGRYSKIIHFLKVPLGELVQQHHVIQKLNRG